MSEHRKIRDDIHRRILEIHAEDDRRAKERTEQTQRAAVGAAFVASFAALLPTEAHLVEEIDALIEDGFETVGEISAALETYHPSTATMDGILPLIRGRLARKP